MKKFLLAALVVVLLAAGAVGGFMWYRSNNAPAVDTWIGKQVVRIASGYIEPTVDFSSVLYTAPYHVELKGATLTARDGTRVAEIGTLVLELADLPAAGKPIQIKKIVLDHAALSLIEVAQGGFKGLVPFVRGTRDTRKVDEDVKLSSVLRLDKVEIRDASVTYQLADGSPPMVLSGLGLDLNIAKAAGGGGAAGTADGGVWYDLDTSFGRAPQLTATLKGAVNLDSMTARVAACDLAIDIGEQTIQSLPPQIQSVLREHDARGKLTVGITGTVPLMNAIEADVEARAAIADFNVAQGEYKFPIPRAELQASLKGGAADLRTLDIRTLGGAVTAKGTARLAGASRPADLAWKLENLEIRELLRAGARPGEQPKFAGVLNAAGTVRTSLDDPKGALAGDGTVTLRNGRLILLPGLKELAEAMSVGTSLLGSAGLSHSADATFTLAPDGVHVSESVVTTEFLSARGSGLLGFNNTMDMKVNAGPIEKVQGLLGKAGKILGAVTDQALKYHVHGPIDKPKVDVLPLGIGG